MKEINDTDKRNKQKKTRIAAAAVLLLLTVITAALFLRIRNSVIIKPVQEYLPDSVACFYQKDPLWAEDTLGGSSYSIKKSGCLISCIASALIMQDMVPEAVPDMNPGSLNRFFSERKVYDEEGNVQWEMMEQALDAQVVRKQAGELAKGELDGLLAQGCYPIVRVRVNGLGNSHYVLIVKSDGNQFWCMDSLDKELRLFPMSSYGSRIYAVRYIQA